MAGKTSAAGTPDVVAATTKVETPAQTAVEPAQENNVTKQLEELTAKLGEYESVQERLTKERNEAIAERLRQEAMYKGLQNQTTKTLQKAAQDRKELEQTKLERATELSQIREMLDTLTSHVLGDDEKEALKVRQRELQLKQREDAVQAMLAQASQPQIEELVATPQQYVTPDDEKAQFLSYYFPGIEIDPKNPNIDWGDGASSTQEAFRRFTTSVSKINDEQNHSKTNDAVATLQKQAEEQLAALKQQQVELQAKAAEEISAAKTEATETARKEAEKRLRAMGADVAGTPVSDGSKRTLDQQLNEELDDNLLKTKEGRKEYDRRVEAIRKQVREQFQR